MVCTVYRINARSAKEGTVIRMTTWIHETTLTALNRPMPRMAKTRPKILPPPNQRTNVLSSAESAQLMATVRGVSCATAAAETATIHRIGASTRTAAMTQTAGRTANAVRAQA